MASLFQFKKGETDKLLLSICSPSSRQKSGGIGTMELTDLTQPTNSMYIPYNTKGHCQKGLMLKYSLQNIIRPAKIIF